MKELTEFLKDHPHLIPMQLEIERNLMSLDKSEDRMYYLCVAWAVIFIIKGWILAR